MNVLEIFRRCAAELREAGIDNASSEARWIVLESAGLSSADFLMDAPISPESVEKILDLTARRISHEPLQYLLGTAPFGDLDLLVTPDVLIPRPETEILAAYAVRNAPEKGKFLDLGCGSGAIALFTARARADLVITAADKSAAALEIARKNAEKYDLLSRIRFAESDLFSAFEKERFSFIAANLPYVTFDEYDTLEPEVKDHEPQLALTAEEDGFALIRRAMESLPEYLEPGGRVIFEMSPHQTEKAEKLLHSLGFSAAVLSDQYGKKRFVAGERR